MHLGWVWYAYLCTWGHFLYRGLCCCSPLGAGRSAGSAGARQGWRSPGAVGVTSYPKAGFTIGSCPGGTDVSDGSRPVDGG